MGNITVRTQSENHSDTISLYYYITKVNDQNRRETRKTDQAQGKGCRKRGEEERQASTKEKGSQTKDSRQREAPFSKSYQGCCCRPRIVTSYYQGKKIKEGTRQEGQKYAQKTYESLLLLLERPKTHT